MHHLEQRQLTSHSSVLELKRVVEAVVGSEQQRVSARDDEHDALVARMREVGRVTVDAAVSDVRASVRELKRLCDAHSDQMEVAMAALSAVEQRPRPVTLEELEKTEKRLAQLQVTPHPPPPTPHPSPALGLGLGLGLPLLPCTSP